MNSASTHLPAEARLQQQLSLVVRVPWDRALSESGGSRTCPGLVVPVLHIFSISHRDTFLSIFKNRDFSSQFLKVFFLFLFFFSLFYLKSRETKLLSSGSLPKSPQQSGGSVQSAIRNPIQVSRGDGRNPITWASPAASSQVSIHRKLDWILSRGSNPGALMLDARTLNMISVTHCAKCLP